MCGKSLLYTVLTNDTAVAAGERIPVGTTIRRYGKAIRQDGDTIRLLEPGYYKITVNTIVLPVGIGAISSTLNQDGFPVDGGVATNTPTAAAAETQLVINTVLRVYCGSVRTINVVLSAAGLVTSNSIIVEKE